MCAVKEKREREKESLLNKTHGGRLLRSVQHFDEDEEPYASSDSTKPSTC